MLLQSTGRYPTAEFDEATFEPSEPELLGAPMLRRYAVRVV